MVRLAEVSPLQPVDEMNKGGSSPLLRFLGRLLMLLVACLVWLLVLIGAAVVVLLHLLASALVRGTNAMLAAVLSAEVEAKNDVTSTARRLLGRRARGDATSLVPAGTGTRARRA